MKLSTPLKVLVICLFVAFLGLAFGTPDAFAQKATPGAKVTVNYPHQKQGRITPADREKAAENAQKAGLSLSAAAKSKEPTGVKAPAGAKAAIGPGDVPDYFGPYPNWAYSPLPTGSISPTIEIDDPGAGYTNPQVTIFDAYGNGTGAVATATLDANGGIASIALSQAGSGYVAPVVQITDPTGADAAASAYLDLTQPISGGIRKFVDNLPTLTLAQGTPCSSVGYAGTDPVDCYEIHLQQYQVKLSSDLPPTTLRGYVEFVNGAQVGNPTYLGPVVVATKDRPVRIKFVNDLPTGSGGDLFIPVDTTYMGAGPGPSAPAGAMGTDCMVSPKPSWCYTDNRSAVHLHGGATPWISDGTPHQWITPAGETSGYPKGVSVQNVPDMGSGNCDAPNSGCEYLFYSNQQSARLLFYHDHAYGITRLNVYAGVAAGYLITDSAEQQLITDGVLPGVGTPLVIQDKTFVDANTIAKTDPTWKWGTTPGTANTGDLWFPHVYMPNQNPYDTTGANAMGRWDYGPWFWPPFTGLTFGAVPNPYCAPTPPAPGSTEDNPGTYDCSQTPWEPPFIPGTPNPSGVPEGFMDTPLVNGVAYPKTSVPAGPVRWRILNAANDRYWNLSLWVADGSVTTPDGRTNTEVKMVPFNSSQNAITQFPLWWYTQGNPFTLDDRAGGVPDPTTRGPAMIQIGTESGWLPQPAVIKNQPVNYVYNRRDITVLNVNEKALLLGPAERADILVDFSKFAGKTIILYNDSPAPVPASDPRLDYYTNDPHQMDTGGAPRTLPGYGPNTRTIMQIYVDPNLAGTNPSNDSTAPVDYYDPTLFATLQSRLAGAFVTSQNTLIRPQAAFNSVYGSTYPSNTVNAGDASQYVKIQDTTHTFTPYGSNKVVTADLEPKSIIEDFQMDYGRMNALLGNEIPKTNVTNQTSIPQGYIDPPVELVKPSDPGQVQVTPQGTLADGTQLWKITHNGVDTHAIHFHMFDVQIVNRIGWDGAIKPPEANESGWKDTVRMNPLEDVVIALRPIKLNNIPFPMPNSWRLLDPTRPLGSTMGFTNVDPQGNPVTVTNQPTNFGWEYVYHCHLLGHEENDMMRPVVAAIQPEDPSNLTASVNNRTVTLTWKDNSASETAFVVQRSTSQNGPWSLVATIGRGTGRTYNVNVTTTNTITPGQTIYYRVYAVNTVGSTVPGYPQMTVTSGYSNVAGVNVPQPPAAPSNLNLTLQGPPSNPTQIRVRWLDNANNETGFVIQRSVNGGAFSPLTTVGAATGTGTTVTYNDTTVQPGNSYNYQVAAQNAVGLSAYATVATPVAVPAVPQPVTSVSATSANTGTATRTITVNWVNPGGNTQTGFQCQIATNSGFTTGIQTVNVTGAPCTFTGLSRTTLYYVRVRTYNLGGYSAYVTLPGNVPLRPVR